MDEILTLLRKLNEPVPKPLRLPTEDDVFKVEKELNFIFPAEYRRFLLEASDVVVGTIEPATIPADSGHTYIVPMVASAREVGVPSDLLPIVEDNGDYYCINNQGGIIFWSHDGTSNEAWPSFSEWACEVWLYGV